jgi:hypothetical protein
MPKATTDSVKWQGATIPKWTMVFLNAWSCNRGNEISLIENRKVMLTLYIEEGTFKQRLQIPILTSACLCLPNPFLNLFGFFEAIPNPFLLDP